MGLKLADMLLRNNIPEALVLAELFAEIPEELREFTSRAFESFVDSSIRGLGELSAAELAIKLTTWLIANRHLV